MGLFGASFEDKVKGAIAQVQQQTPGIASLAAQIDGKIVTLTGTAASIEAKTAAMQAFNALVQTDNTINMIRVAAPAPIAPKAVEAPPPPPEEVIHEVQRGETLSGIAKQHYGKASLYMKIFEANRDVLSNPDLIKPGQKLRIPKL
ncbi:MAG: LysM peptidoglycan-binding domain-containing protein [Acidobacteriota bacterium]|jgi:nucleoid-associated protein YgaU